MKKEFDTLSLVDLLVTAGFNEFSNENKMKLSQNPLVGWKEIKHIIDDPLGKYAPLLDFRYFLGNPNLTFDFMIESNCIYYKHLSIKSMIALSKNPNITYDIIKKYPTGPPGCEWNWCYASFSYNVNVNTDFIIDHHNDNLDWYVLSRSKCVTIEFINNHRYFPWKWDNVFKNPNITIPFILEHRAKIYCLIRVPNDGSITWKEIYENRNLPWDWRFIIMNLNITFDIAVLLCPKRVIHLYSHNPNFSWKIADDKSILKRFISNFKWDLTSLYSSEKTSWEDIKAHMPEKDNIFYYEAIMLNPNLTPLIVYNYFQQQLPRLVNTLVTNPMNQSYYLNDKYVKSKTKEMHDKIYDELMSVACNPDRCLSSWMAIDDVCDLEYRWKKNN